MSRKVVAMCDHGRGLSGVVSALTGIEPTRVRPNVPTPELAPPRVHVRMTKYQGHWYVWVELETGQLVTAIGDVTLPRTKTVHRNDAQSHYDMLNRRLLDMGSTPTRSTRDDEAVTLDQLQDDGK